MIGRERAQALVEAVVAVPVCVACAMTVVDCGVLVRDRIVTAQAATRAAEAHIAGRDELAAARSAVPAGMRDDVRVDVQGARVVVRLASGARIVRLAGGRVEHRSTAAFDTTGGTA